jgi:aquaporin Z
LLIKVDDRPLGGASMDPFRSLAPALLAGGKPLREVWIFIVGPMVGAVLAALFTFMLGSRVHPYAVLDANGTHRTRTRALTTARTRTRAAYV